MLCSVAPVAVTAHKSLHCSKCVVRNGELATVEPEEIKEIKENVPIITDVHLIIVKGTMRRLKPILLY